MNITRTILRYLWITVGLIVLGGCRTPPAPYFFVVGADPQLYFNQTDDRNWRATVGHVNRLRPDFFIVCGDLINADNDAAKWQDPEVMKRQDAMADDFHKVARSLDPAIPLRLVAGNHDVSLQPTPATIAWYEKRFASAWYTFEHKESFFVVLESNLLRDAKGAPELAETQWKWFQQTLREASKRQYYHKTAYMHHPLCVQRVDERDGYFNVPVARRQEMLKLFHEHGFRAVFCGHYHRNAYVKDGELELITTSSCGTPLGDDPLGFRIVKVFPDRIEHEYHSFEKMPERVEVGREGKAPAAPGDRP